MVFAILTVYRVLLLVGLVVGSPWWLWRMATVGRYRAGLWQRVWPGFRVQGSGPRVWVHAVSVGEVLAATGVVKALREAGFGVVVSTTTEAGQELARDRFTGCEVFYLPLDFGVLMGRVLDAVRPRLVVTMESELWPNLIHACWRRGVPLAVVNARVSDRSYPRYRALRWVWEPLLREVSLFLAQGEETAERLRRMGVERVRVTGNLKYDTAAGEETAMAAALRGSLVGRRVVVAGSTLAGEEAEVLAAWAEVGRDDPLGSVLVLAPRHKERFGEVLALVGECGFHGWLASEWVGLRETVGAGMVVVLDTIGDLASVYGLAAVAFVGGSLVAKGGHNPLEAARFGVPVVMGESYFNFREIVGVMLAADAVRIVRGEELGKAVAGILRDGDGGMGERGRGVFAAQAGTTGRTVKALLELVR